MVDNAGLVSIWTIVQILIVLIVPVSLFVFWWYYLRRVESDREALQGPFAGQRKTSPTSVASDALIQCKRCGLRVRPPRGGPPHCPNCMNLL